MEGGARGNWEPWDWGPGLLCGTLGFWGTQFENQGKAGTDERGTPYRTAHSQPAPHPDSRVPQVPEAEKGYSVCFSDKGRPQGTL